MIQRDMSWSWKLGAIHLRNRRGVFLFATFFFLMLLEVNENRVLGAQKLPKVLGPMGNGEQQAGDFVIPKV